MSRLLSYWQKPNPIRAWVERYVSYFYIGWNYTHTLNSKVVELNHGNEWVSHKISEFSTVKTKRLYLIQPQPHNGKWHVHTSNHQVTHSITMSSINSMYGYIADEFMTDFRSYFIWYFNLIDYIYIYMYKVKPVLFSSWKTSTYCNDIFAKKHCFLNTFEMTGYVHVSVYRIGVNCIQTNSNKIITWWKPQ